MKVRTTQEMTINGVRFRSCSEASQEVIEVHPIRLGDVMAVCEQMPRDGIFEVVKLGPVKEEAIE